MVFAPAPDVTEVPIAVVLGVPAGMLSMRPLAEFLPTGNMGNASIVFL
jgi:hypothetical protein